MLGLWGIGGSALYWQFAMRLLLFYIVGEIAQRLRK
jgi:hypothetical protein